MIRLKTPRASRLVAAISAAAFSLLSGCTTTESAQKDDPPVTETPAEVPPEGAPADAAPPPEEPATVTTTPAPTPAAPAPTIPPPEAAKPAAVVDDPDGIDDETPIPASGDAATKFRAAVDVSVSDPKAAISKFEEAGRASPKFYAAWFNAGAAAERAGDTAAAERNYRKALDVRSDYGPALVNLYLLLKAKGNAAAANAVVDKALREHPLRAGPHLAAAMRAYSEKNFAKTKEEALAAIRIDERTVAAMRLMGAVFRSEKRFETAKFALENALVLEPGNALLHLDLGHVKLALEDEKGARESFEKAVKLRPNLAEAQEQYGILMERYGDPDTAVLAYQKAASLRPTSAEAQLHLGNGLRAQKKFIEAEAAYKKALELNPSLHVAHFNLGLLYMDNDIEGRDGLEQMNNAVTELTTFADAASPSKAIQDRLADYQDTLKRRIKREEKRRKRDAERKAIEEEEKAKAAGATETPPEGASTDGAATTEAAPEGGAAAADGDKVE